MLGSGFTISIVVLFVQLVTPVLILIFAVRESNRFPIFLNTNNTLNFENGNVGGWNDGNLVDLPGSLNLSIVSSYDLALVFYTNWDVFCHSYVA